MMKKLLSNTSAALLVFSLLASSHAEASLIAYDGFDYVSGTVTLDGSNRAVDAEEDLLNGGSGWGGAWRRSTESGNVFTHGSIQPGFSYSSLPVEGNRLLLGTNDGQNSSLYRDLSTTVGGSAGEVWISMIARFDTDTTGYFALYRGNDVTRLPFVGATSQTDWNWGLFNGANSNRTATTKTVSETSFLLLKLDYGSGGVMNSMQLWVNPDLGNQTLLGDADATLSSGQIGGGNNSFDRIRTFGSDGQNFDEIRIGTTFDAVAIPEPGTYALGFGIVTLVMVLLRRRSR